MLTIVGYSINATIVIFDRIREELKEDGRAGDNPAVLRELVNRCITQTLTRSIYTSLTTFITIAVLYVMGVSSIKEFALPLMVGIVCGAYSSVCITGALWFTMKTKGAKLEALNAESDKLSVSAQAGKSEPAGKNETAGKSSSADKSGPEEPGRAKDRAEQKKNKETKSPKGQQRTGKRYTKNRAQKS